MNLTLSTAEQAALKRHESVIQAGKNTWIAVSLALIAIREGRLYRATHSNFDDYARQKWGFTKQRVSQLEISAKVMKALPEKASTIVDTEWAARSLSKVPADKRAEVVERAAKSGKVTGKSISEAASETKVEQSVEDADGIQVPSSILETWLLGKERIGEVLHYLSKLKGVLRAASEQDDPIWRQINSSAVIADLSKLWTSIDACKPYAVCPQCQGHPEVGKCRLCLNTGYIGKFRYQAVPKELLELRKKGKVKK